MLPTADQLVAVLRSAAAPRSATPHRVAHPVKAAAVATVVGGGGDGDGDAMLLPCRDGGSRATTFLLGTLVVTRGS
ncbi:hypothetical protein GCM10027047_14170 [Rhodococcus aerolatus]